MVDGTQQGPETNVVQVQTESMCRALTDGFCCRVDVLLPQQFPERAASHQLDVDGTNEYRKQRASTAAVISSVKETHYVQSYHGRSQTLRSPTCSLAVLTTTRTDNQ